MHLDEITECIVETSVESQRKNSEDVFVSSIFVSDIFGGKVDELSQLVPFILSGINNIRTTTLKKADKDAIFDSKVEKPTLFEIEKLLTSEVV